MADEAPVVYVVDDDGEMRQSVAWLLKSVGLEVRGFSSGPEFLDAYDSSRPGCLLLDLRMPQMGGLELQDRVSSLEIDIPVIIMTGHAEVSAAVRAMKAGAVDFIEKPFGDHLLIERVQQAVQRAVERFRDRTARASVAARLKELTPREREVMTLVVEGLANKQVASRLGLSERTVEIHRAQVMRKLDAGSVAELVRMVLSVR